MSERTNEKLEAEAVEREEQRKAEEALQQQKEEALRQKKLKLEMIVEDGKKEH